jgi:hypothetical protein
MESGETSWNPQGRLIELLKHIALSRNVIDAAMFKKQKAREFARAPFSRTGG